VRALVIAHGDPPSADLLRSLARDALVVCADGAIRYALDAGIEAHAVVGDLDSIGETRHILLTTLVVEDRNPNTTDLQKAVDWAIAAGRTDITIAAAGGGRADHHLANLSMLTLYRGRARIAIADDLFDISLVEGTSTIEAEPGTVISLVAIGRCDGVTTHGLRWDLEDFTLDFSPLGVHNEVRESPATVSVRSGDLLLFRGRFIEKHG
jgi:thiamine pyrophosphokinase